MGIVNIAKMSDISDMNNSTNVQLKHVKIHVPLLLFLSGVPNLKSSAKAFEEPRPPPSPSPLRTFRHAAVASDAKECAEIGE